MRKHLLFIAILICTTALAEDIPAGYYNAISGQADNQLKQTLSAIIRPHTAIPYGSGTGRTWEVFYYSDRDTATGLCIDMYSDDWQLFTAPGVAVTGCNIEHSFAKSWWGGTQNDAYKDCYHLNPSNSLANSSRSNYPPGIPTQDIKSGTGSLRVGKATYEGETFWVFEPKDEYKGDFARAYFYMATCYGEELTWRLDNTQVGSKYAMRAETDSDAYLEFRDWEIAVLLAWHRQDPVSQKEIRRADAVSDFQHNHNPFIDYPELAEYIWGSRKGQAVVLDSLHFHGIGATYPQDTTEVIPSQPEDTTAVIPSQPEDSVSNPGDSIASPFMALPATDVTDTGFTARWTDVGSDFYILDVFTRTADSAVAATPDTLIHLASLGADDIASSAMLTLGGKTYHDNNSTLRLGTGKGDGTLTISLPPLQSVAQLHVTAASYGADASVLLAEADGEEIGRFELSSAMQEYTIAVPEGSTQIVLSQAVSRARVVLRSLLLIDHAPSEQISHLEGYPQQVTGCSHVVICNNYPVCYRVETADGQRSDVIQVVLPEQPVVDPENPNIDPEQPGDTGLQDIQPTSGFRMLLLDGKLFIQRGDMLYTLSGQRVR